MPAMRNILFYISILGILFCVLIVSVSSCSTPATGDKGTAEESKTPNAVETMKIETGAIVDRLSYTGDIEGVAEIRVFSPIPDRIISLKAKEGDRVRTGDILATIRSSNLTQGVRQAAGGLDAVRAQRVSLQDQMDRLQKLKSSGAVTNSQLLSVESQLAGAEAQVRQLEATLGQARQLKGDAVIRAPIDGVIGQVFLEVGDMAVPQLPVCTVVDMDNVRIKVRVPESDLTKLNPGQPATYEVAVTNGDLKGAVVSRVSPVLDRLSRTATMEIDVDNPDHSLKPGMLARVQVEVEKRENAVWVPKDTVTVTTERQGEANLYRAVVVENGKAVERKVLLGLEDGNRVEVLQGLKSGEELVIEGQHLLANGDPVRIAKAASPEGKAAKNAASAPDSNPAPLNATPHDKGSK
jgi:RND family efflux transporter MFP subunit